MFRFTIRDVLWLTVVVAVGMGWALDHWRQVESQRVSHWVWQNVAARNELKRAELEIELEALRSAAAPSPSPSPTTPVPN